MNIWIINHYAIPPSLGGLSRHYYFSKYLRRMGHEVKIFSASAIHNSDVNFAEGDAPFVEKEMDGVPYTFVRTDSYQGNGLSRIKNMLQFPFRVGKVCRQFPSPDVIYTSSPSPFTAVAALRIAKKYRCPCVVEVRDLWPQSIVEYNGMSPKHPAIVALYQLEKWMYKKADRLIFTMEGGKDYIKERGWDSAIDLNKVCHLNNGIDLEESRANRETYTVNDPDLLDDSTFKVVYAGSIRLVNNVGLLLDAAKIIQKQEPSVRFLIYGNGTEKTMLEQRLKDENIQNVRFKGRVEKKFLPYILSHSNLNVLTFQMQDILQYGGSQNKLFEYFASGRPVFADVEMGYNLIKRYQAGRSTSDQSPENIANNIMEIVHLDADSYNQYCRNALRAAKDYDFPMLSEKLAHILEDCIK